MTPVDPNDGAGVRELATLCGVIAKLRAQVDLLTTERDDARRQRDECAAALATIGHQAEAQQILDATAPATNDDARAILHTLASTPARPHVAVVVERASIALCLPFPLRIRLPDRHEIAVTTDEAVALITALLADGAVHSAWLHGRGRRQGHRPVGCAMSDANTTYLRTMRTLLRGAATSGRHSVGLESMPESTRAEIAALAIEASTMAGVLERLEREANQHLARRKRGAA